MASSPDGGLVLESVRAVLSVRSGRAAGCGLKARRAGSGPARWWVAFSGGVDSTVLLDAAVRVLGERAAERVAAVHVNHGLHRAADAWAEHCRTAAALRGIRIEVRRVSIPGERGGLEAAARSARLSAFAEVVPAGEPILLAHHRDDQAETVLLRILRGAGPAGTAAMRPDAEVGGLRLVRPLLAVPRAEILVYARSRGLSWIEDPANFAPEHDRNYIRHRVLPAVAERWPGAGATFARLALRSQETASMLDDLAAADLAAARGRAPGTLRAQAIAALSPPRAANALRAWLVSHHRVPPPPRNWLRLVVAEMAAARPDRRPQAVRSGIWIRRYRGDLHTGRERAVPRLPASMTWRLDAGPLDLPHGRLAAVRANGDGLAVARLPLPVEVRFRQGGERCRPHPRAVTKPLKDLFQELGVPPWERSEWPLLFAGASLVAAPGLFRCDPFAAREAEPAWRIEWTPRRHG